AGVLCLLVAGRRMRGTTAGWVATSGMAVSFAAALVTFASTLRLTGADRFVTKGIFTWVAAGGFSVKASLLIDPLSVTMALFVTGVGMLIHLYAIGYMEGDERYPTFFVYLNLFAFSMLVLVMADNLLFTFLGWEGVGVCSYFLISFWFERETAAVAGKKAFVTNRVGDVGFLLAMFLAFATFHSLDYFRIFAGVQRAPHSTLVAIGLLLFLGACGKSAQLPLFVWLPDAMEGPTPVSALIHAATMVTAGVYVVARSHILFAHAPTAMLVVAIVGCATAFFAATIGLVQTDIKKVLAYSTVSQLGYMFLACGVGAFSAGIFHLMTHAFFKALLFLAAGSVIHAMGGE